jgi:enoyl-CoA hydratase/carnithine racemase
VDIVTDAERLADEASSLCKRLAVGETVAFAGVKQLVNRGLLSGLDAALDLEARLQGELANSAAFGTAARAFAAASSGS